ncbi:MAG: cysteine--tRNA ligase [Candidatus Omnitrophica bacterium]|nr:cysteine--tRNA ligase [Candidatus Omnitrophota bacterium]
MAIQINNSLTRKKEELVPLNPPQVNIYTCGVTVYDDSHIGHGRSLYIFDVLRHYLEYRGLRVRFVRNITDIEDKIINRARELKMEWSGLVEKYIKSYKEDLVTLGIQEGILDGKEEPRATKNVEEIKKFIQDLLDKGYAYATKSGVYFSVRKFKDYGKLSGQSIEAMLTGVRKESDETKDDPLDFALWKISKEGEPFWESPWGKGRPGWHIECSVMSQKYLKTDTLDIHAGGRDLIFPHHENEIAQSEARSGKPFAKYWIHHGLLTINGQKMAKSLGNFITIKDFMNKYKDADLLKLFFLSAHYSSPIDYSEEKIEEARKQKKSFSDFLDKVDYWSLAEGKSGQSPAKEDLEKIDKTCENFSKAMDDDLNTPQALAALFELADLGSGFVSSDKEAAFRRVKVILEKFLSLLGLSLRARRDIPAAVVELVKARAEAKKNKNFQQADNLREEIKNKYKFNLMDTAGGTTLTEL